jgi:beta-carotene 3-hydroxylase
VTAVALAVGALIVMEPLTTLAHRLVFHGFAMGWHRSHHLPPRRRLEANDLFPVVFSVVTVAVLSVGVYVGAGSVLVPIGIGVTAYGAAYLVVHDLVIHRRVPRLAVPDRVGRRLRQAHNVHHLFGQAPYGFLAPVVPPALRARAEARGVDDTRRAVSHPRRG